MAELTPTQRDAIIQRYRAGDGYRLIARDLALPWEAVQAIVREYLVGRAIWPETPRVVIDLAEVFDEVVKPRLDAYRNGGSP